MESHAEHAGGATAGPDKAQAELLSVDDLATLLRCSPRHIYRLADAGKMPRPMKLGALVRWSRVEVQSWIANGCKATRTARAGEAGR